MKVEKIRQIVQLKQVVRRWRALSLRRLVGDPPPGFLAVYVGPDRQRFVIPTRFLNLPVFAAFLRSAEEEYGFPGPSPGGLALPGDPAFFRCVLDALHRDEARFGRFTLDAFLVLFADHGPAAAAAVASSPCRDSSSYNRPLLPKTKAR
ncbi:auxin-responsive protein SAUR23-like [Zingiber officinale]|uniref:auxin-responsive protein SAUR23-like n=1 Tax=Zingiber officinale TaxID=94328 RepID=UPI001C4AC217|nr:auxin-responsive protein SAUR23-like [Zingiber officinale]